MFFLRMYKSRKYFQRIVLSILIGTVLIMLLYSTVLFYNSEKSVLEMQFEANEQVLAQVEYNVDYMDQMVRTLLLSLRSNSEVNTLLYNQQFSPFDVSDRLTAMRSMVAASNFAHSVMAYNGYNDVFYSSIYYPLDERLAPENKLFGVLEQKMDELRGPEIADWVPTETDGAGKVELFSFFMYELGDPNAARPSAFIVNVKSNWLFDNIKNINNADRSDSTVLVMDESGRVLNRAEASFAGAGELHAVLAERGGEARGYFVYDGDQGRRIVSYPSG